ncbi:MAG: substrate-binding domain-containing protein [Christensenellales bacterium]
MNYEGAVHLFAGSPASTSNVDRLKGFEEYMAANCPKIKVLGTLYSEADINLCTTQTVDVLSANPDLKAIFAVDEVSYIRLWHCVDSAGQGPRHHLGWF